MPPDLQHRTTDFFEAAFLRALGARLLDVEDSDRGCVVLDCSTISRTTLSLEVERLTRELDALKSETLSPEGLRRLYDNTVVGRLNGCYAPLRDRLLRGRRRG